MLHAVTLCRNPFCRSYGTLGIRGGGISRPRSFPGLWSGGHDEGCPRYLLAGRAVHSGMIIVSLGESTPKNDLFIDMLQSLAIDPDGGGG
jgi:hypothetical protein